MEQNVVRKGAQRRIWTLPGLDLEMESAVTQNGIFDYALEAIMRFFR